MKTVIIGAGFGGLSAACFLAKQGHEVLVLEKNNQCGGRAMMERHQGFSFDMGPSWYLMPDVFERFFAHFDKTPKDFYTLKRLDPSYRIFFGTDDIVDIHADLSKNLALFNTLETNGAQKLQEYLSISEQNYNTAMRDFVYKDYSSIIDLFDRRFITQGKNLHLFESFEKHTKRYFTSDRARKILEYTIVFLGGTPKNTPALYSIMSHIDFNLGVWYPEGGMNSVARAIETLAKSLGVQFMYDQNVKHIEVHNKSVQYVHTTSEKHQADCVIANADYHHVETTLLDKKYQSYRESYWEKRSIAPSGFILYLGINKKLPALKHHNLFLEDDWTKHFDTLFAKNKSWPEAPSYYICNPTKSETALAPDNTENLFILVPVAAGLSDTDEIREKFAEKIIAHIETICGTEITSHIQFKKIFSHRDFISYYNAYKGTALGLSHTLRQSALFRPHNLSKKVKNLFFTGQYIHPGIGVPMTLIASEIVSEKIKKQYGSSQKS